MSKPLLAVLEDKFLIDDGCWQWTGSVNNHGYGNVKVDGRCSKAHRVVYELLVGPIPDGLVIDHLCRNRACVRPDHLEPVTHQENVLRGQGLAAQAARRTHCKNGHLLSPDNLYNTSRQRACKTCHKLVMKRSRK